MKLYLHRNNHMSVVSFESIERAKTKGLPIHLEQPTKIFAVKEFCQYLAEKLDVDFDVFIRLSGSLDRLSNHPSNRHDTKVEGCADVENRHILVHGQYSIGKTLAIIAHEARHIWQKKNNEMWNGQISIEEMRKAITENNLLQPSEYLKDKDFNDYIKSVREIDARLWTFELFSSLSELGCFTKSVTKKYLEESLESLDHIVFCGFLIEDFNSGMCKIFKDIATSLKTKLSSLAETKPQEEQRPTQLVYQVKPFNLNQFLRTKPLPLPSSLDDLPPIKRALLQFAATYKAVVKVSRLEPLRGQDRNSQSLSDVLSILDAFLNPEKGVIVIEMKFKHNSIAFEFSIFECATPHERFYKLLHRGKKEYEVYEFKDSTPQKMLSAITYQIEAIVMQPPEAEADDNWQLF